MSTHLHVPSGPLADFVDLIWVYEGYAPTHARERLLPQPLMALIITFRGDDIVWSGVSGPRTESTLLDTSRPFSVVGVSFKAGGGFPFFPMPPGELHNLMLPLDAVWGSRADAVCEALFRTKSPAARCAVLERALLSSARGRFERHPAVRYAVGELGHRKRPRPVARVADQIGLSQRRFIEVFRNEVGLTPKSFSRVSRFQHVLGQLEGQTDADWTGIAYDCGYFDQAHFIHDFREFAGVSPTMYLRNRESRNHIAVRD
jgi:methylphosphotriester-DNA--protein-cysteine methyltransferase